MVIISNKMDATNVRQSVIHIVLLAYQVFVWSVTTIQKDGIQWKINVNLNVVMELQCLNQKNAKKIQAIIAQTVNINVRMNVIYVSKAYVYIAQNIGEQIRNNINVKNYVETSKLLVQNNVMMGIKLNLMDAIIVLIPVNLLVYCAIMVNVLNAKPHQDGI